MKRNITIIRLVDYPNVVGLRVIYTSLKMDYKYKYYELLNKISTIIDNAEKQGHILVRLKDLETAFPELKENPKTTNYEEEIRKCKDNFLYFLRKYVTFDKIKHKNTSDKVFIKRRG